ncbi:hypothetical protein [Bdellovibrio svalbardensis]|uniref:Uncharacterized protein n=1 Tax=Bdellovibrio svalbardensis TaxID=2972972 RepID=A0ABT6DFV8_9BACT|nr:hypothetical protein [Bdellovibrio svalbardensis]MDG0815683.1 hypothetical protein [Bdellovibrio svalbardensis]
MGTERTNRPGASESSTSKSQKPEDRRSEQRTGGNMNRSERDSQRSPSSDRSSSSQKPGSQSGSHK